MKGLDEEAAPRRTGSCARRRIRHGPERLAAGGGEEAICCEGPGGIERQDEYYWMRDDARKKPELIAHLNAENAYADRMLAPLKPLQEKLYSEFVSRIKQDDASVPFRERGYLYYTRFEKGQDYAVVARRKGAMTAREEVLLDQPAMAKGKGYFQISGWEPSQDNRLLAYAEDVVGRRQYVLKVKDLATGRTLPDSVANVESDIVWADDNKTIFYIEKDPVTLLSKRVKAHVLGTPASADRVVYEEKDESFYMGLGRTTSDKFICITLQSTVSNEQRCTSAARPGEFSVLAPREREFRYNADHIGNQWVIRTNWNAPNYKLMRAADADGGRVAAAGRISSRTIPMSSSRISSRSPASRRSRSAPAATKGCGC
jgi:oligopeptidase B